MQFRRSSLLFLLGLSASAGAFTVNTPTAARVVAAPSATALFSAVAPTQTGAKVEQLEPEYQAALDAAIGKLTVALGDKKEKLLAPLEHFVTEYLGCAQIAYGAAKTEEEKAQCTPQAAAGRILKSIQYAKQFGMPDSPALYEFDVTHKALRGNPEEEDGNERRRDKEATKAATVIVAMRWGLAMGPEKSAGAPTARPNSRT